MEIRRYRQARHYLDGNSILIVNRYLELGVDANIECSANSYLIVAEGNTYGAAIPPNIEGLKDIKYNSEGHYFESGGKKYSFRENLPRSRGTATRLPLPEHHTALSVLTRPQPQRARLSP